MAIQFRRGDYEDFQPSKMVAGEPAVVQSGDSTTTTGKGVYICFTPGDVQRLATYEEMTHDIETAMEGSQAIQEYIQAEVDAQLEEHPEWTTTIEDGAVTTPKLYDGAITAAKLNSDALVDNATTNDSSRAATAAVAKGLNDGLKALSDVNTADHKLSTSIKRGFNPNAGSSYSAYGGCYYYKVGHRVHIHLGISGLTANTYYSGIAVLGTAGYKPTDEMSFTGSGGNITTRCYVTINAQGTINAYSTGTYIQCDLEYDAFN